MKQLYLFFLLLLMFLSSQGQNVTIQLIKPTGNDVTLDNTVHAIITNNTADALQVYLRATVEESLDGLVFEGESSDFMLEKNVFQLNQRNIDILEPLDIITVLPDYEDFAARNTALPPGTYEICMQVISSGTDQILAEDCYQITIGQYLPPSLISPENQSIVQRSHPYFIWSPVPGGNANNIRYGIFLVELYGNQSPVAAFNSNPVWFKRNDLISSVYNYPSTGREFVVGQEYAWKVVAYLNGEKIAESQVWTFVVENYGDYTDDDDGEQEDDAENPDPDQYASLSSGYHYGFYLLEDYQLRFAYKNQYSTSKLKCHIKNGRGKIVSNDVLHKKQKPGINFNIINVSNIASPDELFVLECHNELHEIKGLKFKIRQEDDNLIIEELNLEESMFELPYNILEGGFE